MSPTRSQLSHPGGAYKHTNELDASFYPFTTLFPLMMPSNKKPKWKTLREKEKMLVTSIFSFSHNVFYTFQNKIARFLPQFTCLTANALIQNLSKPLPLKLTLFLVANETIVKCRNLFNIAGVNSGKSDFLSEKDTKRTQTFSKAFFSVSHKRHFIWDC